MQAAVRSLPAGTKLTRLFAQPPGAPNRATTFNPQSVGRGSPVFSKGVAIPAMYADIDSPQCAVREYLYHAILKSNPSESVVSASAFAHIQVATITTTLALKLVSIPKLAEIGWMSAPSPNVGSVAVLYQTRVPSGSLKVTSPAQPLTASRDLWDYALNYLAEHRVLVGI
jgi:hypothetical protein